MSEELVRKVNELTAEQEQADGTLLTASEDGDRRLVFKRDLKVEFSNNTTQVMGVVNPRGTADISAILRWEYVTPPLKTHVKVP